MPRLAKSLGFSLLRSLIDALASTRDPDVVPVLERLAAQSKSWCQEAAMAALRDLAPKA